ncbi:uncharacterized protein F5147DRAFT_393840 [Suillus discolor]|uniref:Uncharacterized protein n=1 Tax=Suillus discolor TaxID=1912936 RepID=A0A9P7EYI1_9AGAM|nr:uncharacterized protein F5147DRAFT_393840 [Suillus discolor]KAG2096099.1 hypothetical protein F5147DRAFT_393840 [Suillus discolor]
MVHPQQPNLYILICRFSTLPDTTSSYSLRPYIPRLSISIMNSFKKMFQKSNDDQKAPLKHSKSMPYGFYSEGRKREPLRDDSSKPAYRGKTPLKKSDIMYVKQAPGILDIYHGKLSQHTYYHGPARANVDTRADSDLLAKFPHSPEPTEGLPHRGFRALSLNSKDIKPQIPIYNSGTSGQEAYPSGPHRKQEHEATVDQLRRMYDGPQTTILTVADWQNVFVLSRALIARISILPPLPLPLFPPPAP